jgi:allantoate deiminase
LSGDKAGGLVIAERTGHSIPDFAIDVALLERQIDELGEIGKAHGQLFRPVYGDAWRSARDRVDLWMREAGLRTHVDAVGNLFGRLEGHGDLPAILSGSHLDTVRNAGKYDGALGIHAALAAVRAIARTGQIPQRPLEVVALCEEEGSRFANPMLGTQAILGLLSLAEGGIVDEDGTSIVDAMRSNDLDPAAIASARRDDIGAFIELHIEQGGVLHRDGVALGIVEKITGQRHLVCAVHGQQNHAGTTPMDLRSDALAGSCEGIVRIEQLARSMGSPTVVTVGVLTVCPGSRNVVPGQVSFTVDARHPDPATLDDLVRAVGRTLSEVGSRRGLAVHVDEIAASHRQPVQMNQRLCRLIGACAERLSVSARGMVSGAGHDSQVFAAHVPTAMIFTPSIGGISHSPAEYTPIEMVEPCVRVLADVLWCAGNETAAM